MSAWTELRLRCGALVLDVPRTLWCLRPGRTSGGRAPWERLRNRNERIETGPDGVGARCLWQWTSDLHVARVFPIFGRLLLRRALHDWPVEFADAPEAAGAPQVSFLIGHRGLERLPLLLAVLRSIAAQAGAAIECVVVEQSPHPQIASSLPAWVRYRHTPPPQPEMPYSRTWALNVAAREARGELLVLHDGDMLVPAVYAAEAARVLADGYDVVDLKRFLFELSPEQTLAALAGHPAPAKGALDGVRQNAQGGTLAIRRSAFFDLGGFDETFLGWGGEDNEFWERAATGPHWSAGYLPFVHLWHAPQPGKLLGGEAPAQRRFWELTRRPAAERILRLRQRPWGRVAGPALESEAP